MKRIYIINTLTIGLIMKTDCKTNEDYTIVIEKDATFVVLCHVDDIVRRSMKYYEEDLESYASLLNRIYGKKKIPLVISCEEKLIFIETKVGSRTNEKMLVSLVWIDWIRLVGKKTQLKFKNEKFKTVCHTPQVMLKKQYLCYSVMGVLMLAKRKGI